MITENGHSNGFIVFPCFEDFETIFAFLFAFLFFYFYSLVVFLGDEELIFLWLFVTMISLAYK